LSISSPNISKSPKLVQTNSLHEYPSSSKMSLQTIINYSNRLGVK